MKGFNRLTDHITFIKRSHWFFEIDVCQDARDQINSRWGDLLIIPGQASKLSGPLEDPVPISTYHRSWYICDSWHQTCPSKGVFYFVMKLILGITGIASLIAQAIAQDIWCPPPTTKTSVYSFCPNSCMPPRSTYTTTAHPTITVYPPCPTRPLTPTPTPTSISATRMGKVVTSTCPPYVYETKTVTMPCSSCTYSVLPPLTITVTDQATVTTMLPCPSL